VASAVTVVFHDPNAGWSHEVLVNNKGMTGNGWTARVGDYDPYRPGDEIFYIYESLMDSSIGTLFSEVAGTWESRGIYGWDTWMAVGMDSAAGDFNWEHTGPEIVIATEMGPTYEIVAPGDVNSGDWPIRTVWNDLVNAGWVTKIADVDPWSPGDEIVYGTRFNNRILISRHDGDGPHEVEIIFTGNATEEPLNMWDIAIGDVLLQSPGLEILGVDNTGSVYLVQRIGETWQGQVIWQDSEPLYAVTVGNFLPRLSGDEILVAGESGAIRILIPMFNGILPGFAPVVRYQSDFSVDEDGWTGGFADYPISVLPEDWDMVFGYEPLPASLNLDANGLMLQGDNHSDDLFMYVKRPYDGLMPNTTYLVVFQVDLASNAPTGTVGVGGSPGDSVYVNVGVSLTEPNAIVGDDDYWRMNIDKGNQASSGEDAITIGTIGVELPGVGGGPIYKMKPLDNLEEPLLITTDDQGQVWLLVGTDSGFEALTQIYLADIAIEFTPVPGEY